VSDEAKQTMRAAGAAARARVGGNVRPTLDAAIGQRVMGLDELVAAQRVCCYLSMGKEAGTGPLIDALLAAGKALSVPVADDDGRMFAAALGSTGGVVVGRWGIAVPRDIVEVTGPLDVVVCPGVLFSRTGDRLGRGQGHYDRFLPRHPHAAVVGVCYEAQLAESLPTEPHDVPMHAVVTEADVYRRG